MNQNAFDMGYSLLRVDHCRFHLKRLSSLPIAEFYRRKFTDEFTGERYTIWEARPLEITDEKIDEALPRDWKNKFCSGFSNFEEIRKWIEFN